jgi:DNA repair protein RecO (recombination protein O)
LLLTLLARDDPHPGLFDVYANVVRVLASEHGEALQAALRTYELLLLREIGLLPQLNVQTMTLGVLDTDTPYCLVPEGGLRQAHADDRASLSGAQWAALQIALEDGAPFTTTLRACAAVANELKPQLRALLHYHCGVKTLRIRQMMVDIQSL